MKLSLQSLIEAVARQTSVTASAVELVKGAAQIIADEAKEDETLLSLAATLNSNADKFAEAVKTNTATANTEGAAPPAPIVEAPASEAPVTPAEPATDAPADPAADPGATS